MTLSNFFSKQQLITGLCGTVKISHKPLPILRFVAMFINFPIKGGFMSLNMLVFSLIICLIDSVIHVKPYKVSL